MSGDVRATLGQDAELRIASRPDDGQPCGLCDRRAALDVGPLYADGPDPDPVPVCGSCLAAALATALAVRHVRAGGRLEQITDQVKREGLAGARGHLPPIPDSAYPPDAVPLEPLETERRCNCPGPRLAGVAGARCGICGGLE